MSLLMNLVHLLLMCHHLMVFLVVLTSLYSHGSPPLAISLQFKLVLHFLLYHPHASLAYYKFKASFPQPINKKCLVSQGSTMVVSDAATLAKASAKEAKMKRFVITCAILASTNSVLLGYDVGVMSGAVLFMKRDLHINDVQIQILIGSLNIISLLGSALAGRTSDAIGRRWTMALAAMIFLAGALLMSLAPNFGWLMAGRLIAGIGVGYALLIAPVYTAEVAPAASRGALTCFPEIFINVGILIGYVVNYALAGLPDHLAWRVMIGLGVVPPIFLGLAVLTMPESPRWLVMRDRKEEAMNVLLRTSPTQEEAAQRLADIVEGIEYAREKSGGSSSEGSWGEILKPSPVVRRMLIIGLGIQFFQQATGIDATVYYSPSTFKSAGLTSQGAVLGATIAVGCSKMVFVVMAAFFIDRVGRRVLLLTSTFGSMVSCVIVGTCLLMVGRTHPGAGNRAASMISVVSVCANVAFFSVGMGPVNWVLGAEIYPLRLRAKASSLGVAVNRGMSGVISMTFLSISHGITFAGTFYLFAGVSAVATVFVYFLVPETKGKTLEEIVAFFHMDDVSPSELELGKVTENAGKKPRNVHGAQPQSSA